MQSIVRFVQYLLFVSFYCVNTVSANLTISGVTVFPNTKEHGIETAKAEIIFNDIILVKDITVLTLGTRKNLLFPVYTSRSGRRYPNAWLRTKSIDHRVKKAVLDTPIASRTLPAGGGNTTRFVVKDVSRIDNNPVLKALVTVIFENELAVECKVLQGKNSLWVAWPSVRSSNGTWVRQVVITRKSMKKTIEQAILEKYAGAPIR